MTINECINKSPVRMACRKYSMFFRQIITEDRRAYLVSREGTVVECGFPNPMGDNWSYMLPGSLYNLVAKHRETVQCGPKI